jgi:hypothetical protein
MARWRQILSTRSGLEEPVNILIEDMAIGEKGLLFWSFLPCIESEEWDIGV